MKPALLVLDAQYDFFGTDNPNLAAFQLTVAPINAAIAFFRQHNLPVFFIQHTSSQKPEGSSGWEIYPGIDCLPNDMHLMKTSWNAFWDTKLDSLLKTFQADSVLLCGYLSEYCILSTYRGAIERGYQAIVLEDGIASLEDENTTFVLKLSKHISLAGFEQQSLA